MRKVAGAISTIKMSHLTFDIKMIGGCGGEMLNGEQTGTSIRDTMRV